MHIQKSSEASKVEMLFRTRAPTFISFVKKKKKKITFVVSSFVVSLEYNHIS